MIFEFYWSWHESYCPYLFEHSSKTEEEFANDCIHAMKECFDDYMKQENGWKGLSSWIDFACKKLEDYGYKPVKPVKYGLFGGFIIDKNDKEEEGLKVFSEQLDVMIVHNNKFREET